MTEVLQSSPSLPPHVRTPAPIQIRPSLVLASYTLAHREVVRFVRQRSRLIGAVGQPVMFWILFGAGLSGSFQFGEGDTGHSFGEYFLPGAAVLIVLFTAIFSSISIIQDRNEGFLQGVLVSPSPRLAIVLGKVLGSTILSLLQAGLFLVVAPLLHTVGLVPPLTLSGSPINLCAAAGFLTLIAVSLSALGYLFAWQMDSVQGFHALMSTVLLPMWLLSGAFFPGTGSRWVTLLMRINPLTYGVAGLRRSLQPENSAFEQLPASSTCWLVLVSFTVVCLACDVWLTHRRYSS